MLIYELIKKHILSYLRTINNIITKEIKGVRALRGGTHIKIL